MADELWRKTAVELAGLISRGEVSSPAGPLVASTANGERAIQSR